MNRVKDDGIGALPRVALADSANVNQTKNAALAALISEASIRGIAGDTYYRRGHDYYSRGRVLFLEESGANIRSVVDGTERYAVLLTADGKVLDHDCECPLGIDGLFCKHCVATALAWLHGQIPRVAGAEKKTPASEMEITDEDVVKALEAEGKDTLIRLLLDWSERDDALRERLMLLVAGRKGGGVLLARVRRSLEQAIRIRGFVDYQKMPGYAARIDAALDAVEAMLDGQAGSVIELCESGMHKLVGAISHTDDSDGYMGGLIERLENLHLRASEQARPDAEALAGRLFSCEMKAEYDEWSNSVERYAEVLGEKGTGIFRKLAEAEWAKVPVQTGQRSYSERGNYNRITRIMESLARQSGDVEQLVAVLERNLSSSYQYLRIAEEYRRAGRYDKALEWAERGAAATSGYDGAALRLFVAEEYQRQERHADALRMIWIEFRNGPGLVNYKLLQRFATEADEWDEWRERALAHVRRVIAEKPSESRTVDDLAQRWRDRNRDRSLLVEIFLFEGRDEEAWQEAQAGGCSDHLWLNLAEKHEKAHPEGAARIYLRLGEAAIVNAQSSRYDPAIALLEKAAGVLHSVGKSDEFEESLEGLRLKYKARRSLQKLAEERRRFLYLR